MRGTNFYNVRNKNTQDDIVRDLEKITGREYSTFEAAYDWFNRYLFELVIAVVVLVIRLMQGRPPVV